MRGGRKARADNRYTQEIKDGLEAVGCLTKHIISGSMFMTKES